MDAWMITVIVWTTTKTLCNLDTGKSILMPLHKTGRFSFVHVYCYIVHDIIKLTYYHCTSIDWSVHCE